ncbi:MAG: hypothetical protein Q7T85_12395 [Nitrosomonas sp.]|nr:hypothetical protein [Nitrosomonas sp.]
MKPWFEQCENWLSHQYRDVLGLDIASGPVRLRWLPENSLTSETVAAEAHGLAVEDADIGWLLFLLPYEQKRLGSQINQALGLRSRLLRESNYTGKEKADENEDQDSTWRVGLIWLVVDSQWIDWQSQIMELRRESGAVEEISVDAIKIMQNNVSAALDAHRLPRLLLHTRALLSQSAAESEKWLSADVHVAAELQNFSQQFNTPRARSFARELEDKAESFQPKETRPLVSEARLFRRFRVEHFRNLDTLEVVADHAVDTKAQAIVLFGPNGTGKSSFAEALSLAAFNTSPRLEQFMVDKDLWRPTTDTYLNDYLTPLTSNISTNAKPCFVWDKGDGYDVKTLFELKPDGESKRRFEGVVLNQEDSLKFTDLPRDELAARVLKGYSALADHLLDWLTQEEKRTEEAKLAFTRKYGLSGAIKRSVTAYDRLAQSLLSTQLKRPSPEFLDWMHFLGKLSDEEGRHAAKLVSEWTSQQSNVVIRLAESIAKLQAIGATQSQIAQAIREKIDEFDRLAKHSSDFHRYLETRIATLREQIDVALTQMESWGAWLVSQATTPTVSEVDSQALKIEIESIAKERTTLEINGKTLRGRLDLLDQAQQFLTNHWNAQHPDTCPVCNSDVAEHEGIVAVVTALQAETNATIQTLRVRHVEIQNRQKDMDAKLKAIGASICPLVVEDQARLKDWLKPFLPENVNLENWLADPQRRGQLKDDLSRMRIFPETPRPYVDATLVADRLASDFIALAQEADKALEDPQSIGEVKKALEKSLENVLKNHLPSTLEKVWLEISMSLTTASWLLPIAPALKLDQRGKSLSVQTSEKGQYIRYLYNAAERHVLGLAWFFTYYLAKRRFEEAWMLLDDPAQEMDQPSFRELVRLWETLLRIHQRKERSFTMIVALHQEERALDATRATNGQLYILGWQKEQQETSSQVSVKKVVLLAQGFHPLKPENMFSK